MLLTPHLLAGAAIASNIQLAPLALILAFLSHYFLDLFPHQEYSVLNIKKKRWSKSLPDLFKVFSDIALGVLIIFLLAEKSLLIFAAAFMAIVPDGLTLLFCIFPKNKLLAKHWRCHGQINAVAEIKKLPAFWGILSQLAVIALAIFFLL